MNPLLSQALIDGHDFSSRLRSQSAPIEPLGGNVIAPAAALADEFLASGGIEFDDVFGNMDLLTNPQD